MVNSKKERELLNMAGLAKHLGITKVRVHTLCKEKRLKPDYEINGRYLWKPSSADKIKEAFKSPGVKGKPKVLDLQKKHKDVSQRENPEDSVSVSIESAVVLKTEKAVAPVNNSDKENLEREEQDFLMQCDKQESQGEEMKEVKVYEEPKKFRWQCPGCGHTNRKDAHEDEGSVKTELKCWACNMTIKFNQGTNTWYQV
jgi:hypothetical protein